MVKHAYRGCLTVAAALFASACAQQPSNSVNALGSVKPRDDHFLAYKEYNSPPFSRSSPLLSGETARISTLVGRVERQTRAKYFGVQVLVNYRDGKTRGFDVARAFGGETLALTTVEQPHGKCASHTNCNRDEVVFVSVPERMLRNTGPEGLYFKLFRQSGESAVVTVPRDTISALLANVDADPALQTASAGK